MTTSKIAQTPDEAHEPAQGAKKPRKKGGRARTGTVVKTRDGRLQAVITLVDGTRKRMAPFPRGTSEAMAEDKTKVYAERALEENVVAKPRPVKPLDATSDNSAWLDAWIEDRKARGQTSTRENVSHYRHHILPSIGPKHVRDWTPDDLRKLASDLDTKIQLGGVSWKMAWNVWGTATRMCSDAAGSKINALRVRADNPSIGVRGPDRGAKKEKQFLYPSEFLALVNAPTTPLMWKRLVTLATYLYVRVGELAVLDWSAVDLEHGAVHIHRARDRNTGETKSTKGRQNRRVPIEAELVPLLTLMRAEAGGAGHVMELQNENNMALNLRRYLKKAGVTRAELHETNATHKSMTFHDLRATGVTWQAVRGDDPLKIQYRAGHEDLSTTQDYIRMAEMLRTGFGTPFPALSLDVLRGVRVPEKERGGTEIGGLLDVLARRAIDHAIDHGGLSTGYQRRGRDSNPR